MNILQDLKIGIDVLLYEVWWFLGKLAEKFHLFRFNDLKVSNFHKLLEYHVPWALAIVCGDSLTLQEKHKFEFDLLVPLLRKALFVNVSVNIRQAKVRIYY